VPSRRQLLLPRVFVWLSGARAEQASCRRRSRYDTFIKVNADDAHAAKSVAKSNYDALAALYPPMVFEDFHDLLIEGLDLAAAGDFAGLQTFLEDASTSDWYYFLLSPPFLLVSLYSWIASSLSLDLSRLQRSLPTKSFTSRSCPMAILLTVSPRTR